MWIVGGGSGHGFKHGPAVGELTAAWSSTGEQTRPTFASSAKGTQAQRTVY